MVTSGGPQRFGYASAGLGADGFEPIYPQLSCGLPDDSIQSVVLNGPGGGFRERPGSWSELWAPLLGCASWLLNLCLIYYVFSLLINTFSTRLRHLAKHVYTTSVTMFSAFVTMIR